MNVPNPSLTEQGIASLNAGDTARAHDLLVQALLHNAQDARAWLWLSGAVADDAERKFCLECAQVLDPDNPAIHRGLTRFPAALVPKSPLPPYIDEQHRRAAARAVQPAPVTAVMVSPQIDRKIDRTALSEPPKPPKRASTKRWWLLLLVCVIIGGIAAIAFVPDASVIRQFLGVRTTLGVPTTVGVRTTMDTQHAIIGEWRSFASIISNDKANAISSMQFYADGSIVVRVQAAGKTTTLEGTYKFLDDHHLQLKFGAADPLLIAFDLADNKLTITELNGKKDGTVLIRRTN